MTGPLPGRVKSNIGHRTCVNKLCHLPRQCLSGRSATVKALLDTLERHVVAPQEPLLFWMLDGKPMTISGCSKDRQAGYGRAAGGKGKGYKIHAIIGFDGTIAQWGVAPMNKDERVMGERLVSCASRSCGLSCRRRKL